MEYEEDERSEYENSEVYLEEEPDPLWTGEEGYDYDSWNGETDSEISLEEVHKRDEESWYEETDSEGAFEEEEEGQVDDEIEPEPPDGIQDTTSNHEGYGEENHEGDSWSEETESCFTPEEEVHEDESQISLVVDDYHVGEFSQQEVTFEENRPWCEIPYSDHEEEYQEETDSQISLESEHYGEGEWHHEAECEATFGEEPELENDFAEENEALSEDGRDDVVDDELRYINFSGRNQGTAAYLEWEHDLEQWFQHNQIPEYEKVDIAEETLTEDAFAYWDLEAYEQLGWRSSEASWEEMRQIMSDGFVKSTKRESQCYATIKTYSKPRRWILAKPKAATKRTFRPNPRRTTTDTLQERNESKTTTPAKKEKPKAIATNPSAKQLCNPQGKGTQGKSSNLIKINGLTCYKCKNIGHIAKDCPKKKKLIPPDDGDEQHLVTQATPDIEESQVSSNLNLIISDKTCSTNFLIHLSATKDAEKVSGIKEENRDQEEASKGTKVFSDRNQNQGELTPMENEATAKKDESINHTINLKEEPPDAQQTDQNRGKILNPFTLQWTNLPSLCVGGKVLRTKPLEEGGDDVRIKYLDGLGFEIHQQYAYFGDIYQTIFDDQHAKQELTQQVGQEVAQDISHLPFLELSAFNCPYTKLGDDFLLFFINMETTCYLDAAKTTLLPSTHQRSKNEELFHNLRILFSINLKGVAPAVDLDHCGRLLKSHSVELDIPRQHHYSPKLSRLKRIITSLFLAKDPLLMSNGSFDIF